MSMNVCNKFHSNQSMVVMDGIAIPRAMAKTNLSVKWLKLTPSVPNQREQDWTVHPCQLPIHSKCAKLYIDNNCRCCKWFLCIQIGWIPIFNSDNLKYKKYDEGLVKESGTCWNASTSGSTRRLQQNKIRWLLQYSKFMEECAWWIIRQQRWWISEVCLFYFDQMVTQAATPKKTKQPSPLLPQNKQQSLSHAY